MSSRSRSVPVSVFGVNPSSPASRTRRRDRVILHRGKKGLADARGVERRQGVPGGKKARIDWWVSTWERNSTLPSCRMPRFAVSPVEIDEALHQGPRAFEGVWCGAGRPKPMRKAPAPTCHVLLGRVEFDHAMGGEGREHPVDSEPATGRAEAATSDRVRPWASERCARMWQARSSDWMVFCPGGVVERAGASAAASFGHGLRSSRMVMRG